MLLIVTAVVLSFWFCFRTRCQTEDEEEVIAKELETMFPNTIDDDFGEFIDTVTLEQNKRKLVTDQQNARKTTTLRDILLNEDIKLICVTFTDIMAKFSRSYYYNPKRVNDKQQRLNNIEYIASYKEKTRVFQQLYANYSSCLNSRMDDMFYNGLSLTVGISMENYDLLRLSGKLNNNSGENVVSNYIRTCFVTRFSEKVIQFL